MIRTGLNPSRKKRRLSSAGVPTLGAQARGLHAELRGAWTEQDYLELALRIPHPIVAAQKALEPEWAYVFSQLHEAFRDFGVSRTLQRLNSNRDRRAQFLTRSQL